MSDDVKLWFRYSVYLTIVTDLETYLTIVTDIETEKIVYLTIVKDLETETMST